MRSLAWVQYGLRQAPAPTCAETASPWPVRVWTEPSTPGQHVLLCPCHTNAHLLHPPFHQTLNPGATRHEPHFGDLFLILSQSLVFHYVLPYLLLLGCFTCPKCKLFQQKHALVPPLSSNRLYQRREPERNSPQVPGGDPWRSKTARGALRAGTSLPHPPWSPPLSCLSPPPFLQFSFCCLSFG